MVRKGEIIIAIDPDIRDMYICEVLKSDEENRHNLLVRILEMVAYPIQHAVMHPDIASENPPLKPGSSAMLQFTARVQGSDIDEDGRAGKMADYYRAIGTRGYKASFDKCLADYEAKVKAAIAFRKKYPMSPLPWRDEKELEILERHKRHEFNGRRSSSC